MTIEPGKNWSGQYSYARITSIEALYPSENQERMTASVTYNRPFYDGNWANTLLWGLTRSLRDNVIFNSHLLESTVRFRMRNYAWARIESAERSNELIHGESPLPPGFPEQPIGQVQAYTVAYDSDIALVPHFSDRRAVYNLRSARASETYLRRPPGGSCRVPATASVLWPSEIATSYCVIPV